MKMVYFALGGFVIVVALFKRELLFEPESHRILLGIATVMFVVGAVLVFGRLQPNAMAGSLMSPLVSIGLFWLMRKFFRRRFERDPRDTFLNWKPGMAADRFFNIIYFIVAMISWGIISTGVEKLFNALSG